MYSFGALKWTQIRMKAVSKDTSNIIVKARANIHNNDINFEHLIEHALSCTLENYNEDVSSVSELRFGTLHEVRELLNKATLEASQ